MNRPDDISDVKSFAIARSRVTHRFLMVILFSCLSWGAQVLVAGEVPAGVSDAANNGLQSLLAHVPPGEKDLYGFSKDDNLAKASLGHPFLMHTITPTSLWNSHLSAAGSLLITDTTMWFFPVMLGGEARAMLVVDRQDAKWQAVSLGYGSLAHELNNICSAWPESKGFHPKLVAMFQAKQFYFTVPEVDDINLTPIASPQRNSEVPSLAATSALAAYSSLGSLSNEVEHLRSVVRSAGAEPVH